ncbi:DUF1800 domain-containing protein [Aquimarina litoralis]|uniref:DUF1800 domain-containing protein n=1 Tax=Aquimarina litoralis TaxID=584605 RepID=UPI001C58A783|nr:DUF1800 domain-containing protein [Aquimarina litoralis]MBW1296850.1 DUF1800 family protein [Aquimarina litoralis]
MNSFLTDKQIQHLYWRTGFGISSSELQLVRTLPKKEIIDRLFSESSRKTNLSLDFGVLEKDPRDLSREERIELRKLRNQKMLDLNIQWLQQLAETKQVLREKMTLFFHNHFAVRLKTPRAAQHLNNVIRNNALENFGDMLMEVSKSPAMLLFLNNRQNRKNNPNENFAREVMELFTLGRDNGYTETDIKEAARAFTGWNFNKQGSFVFRQKHHDFGSKTILGRTGNFKGEDVIKILLEEKQTAKYITQKIYTYLVNEKIDSDHLETLTNRFYNASYSIEVLLREILESTWFYNPEHIGTKIKSPIELLVGLSKPFQVHYKNTKVLLYLQRKLNQVLFFPPNVAGWKGGKSWIDNSTLMLRLKLASVTLNNGVIEMNNSDDSEVSMMMKQKFYKKMKSQMERKIKATPNWELFLASLEFKNKQQLIDFILQPKLSEGAKNVISELDAGNTKNFIIELMSLPEYQLC